MFTYTAYEFGIHSEIPLPGLVATEKPSEDIVVRTRTIDVSERSLPQSDSVFFGETDGVGKFLVLAGNQIFVDPVPGVDKSLVATILLGPILAILLRQRGLAVIHASCVVINEGAVAFLGQSGWGKSTLARAFYRRGYGVVTDDVMAVRLDEAFPKVLPGYPSVKLFPDAANFLGCEASATHRVHSQTEKKAHCVEGKFPQGPVPLGRMYVLAQGERNEIEPLEPQQVFVELVRNARAVTLLKDEESLRANMRQCSRLAASVPALRLRRRGDLTALPELLELVEKDLANGK